MEFSLLLILPPLFAAVEAKEAKNQIKQIFVDVDRRKGNKQYRYYDDAKVHIDKYRSEKIPSQVLPSQITPAEELPPEWIPLQFLNMSSQVTPAEDLPS